MRVFAALAAALVLAAPCARADTMEDIRRAAGTPLSATVAGEYRTVELELNAAVPDAQAMGVYMAEQAQVFEQSEGEALYVTPPEKRRGIAFRRREEERFAPDTLPEDYRAYASPLTAREALEQLGALLEPHLAALPGVETPWTELAGRSPLYVYDKEVAAWGEQVDVREKGGYRIEYNPTLYGVRLLGGATPFARDIDAYFAEGANMDFGLSVYCQGDASATAEGEPWLSLNAALPRVIKTLAENVQLAPLADVFETVKQLAGDGYLRQARGLELVYYGFVYGPRPAEDEYDPTAQEQYLVKPVWALTGEFGDDPARENEIEPWVEPVDQTALIDAQTAELIERSRVVEWP